MSGWLHRFDKRYPTREVLPNGHSVPTRYEVVRMCAALAVGWAVATALLLLKGSRPLGSFQTAVYFGGFAIGMSAIVAIQRLRGRRRKPLEPPTRPDRPASEPRQG
jgi:hypothetical protein